MAKAALSLYVFSRGTREEHTSMDAGANAPAGRGFIPGLEFVHLSKAAASGTALPRLKGLFPASRWPSLRNEIKSNPMSLNRCELDLYKCQTGVARKLWAAFGETKD